MVVCNFGRIRVFEGKMYGTAQTYKIFHLFGRDPRCDTLQKSNGLEWKYSYLGEKKKTILENAFEGSSYFIIYY